MNGPNVFSAILIATLLTVATPSQARWMNPQTGRFHTMDTFDGDKRDPASLHKYVYAANNPVNVVDPSGHEGEYISLLSAMTIGTVLFAQASPATAQATSTARRVVTGRASSVSFWQNYPDYNIIPPELNRMVWEMIGGNVGGEFGPKGANSCAARVSFGLNYGGAPIPSSAQHPFDAWHNFTTSTYKGQKGDGNYYIVSARQMDAYLTRTWGSPDYKPQTFTQLNSIVSGLRPGEAAVFATTGHSGALKKGYQDPYVNYELPIDVWTLRFP